MSDRWSILDRGLMESLVFLTSRITCTQLDVLPQFEVEPMRIGIISPSRIRRRS